MAILSIIEETVCDNHFHDYPDNLTFVALMEVLDAVSFSGDLPSGFEVIEVFEDWDMKFLAKHMAEIVDSFNELESARAGR